MLVFKSWLYGCTRSRNIWLLRAGSAFLISLLLLSSSFPFEGHLSATLARTGESQTFIYTASPNQLRIERAETNWPHAKNIFNLDSGAITLLFQPPPDYQEIPPLPF